VTKRAASSRAPALRPEVTKRAASSRAPALRPEVTKRAASSRAPALRPEVTKRRITATVATTVAVMLAVCALAPAPASAFNPLKTLCGIAGDTVANKLETGVCDTLSSPGKLLGAGKKLLSGHLGGAVHALTGAAAKAAPALGLAAIVTWVLGGAAFALHETATLLGKTTSPELTAAWFSSTYLHMAAIATLLTLPFLFAAALQALLRSDLALLARAALGYLPLAMLAIAVAAPLTMLLLAASDSLSNIIEGAAGGDGTAFLTKAGLLLGSLTVIAGSPFVAFLIGFFVAAGALALWLELLVREVAVYVIVLMLPLVFAALVWPARRVWAIRAVEVLVAVILAKLAIVSVLALGAGALEHATTGASIVALLAGVALVTLGAFAPWALLKLLPLGELAAAASPLRGHLTASASEGGAVAAPWADWAGSVTAGMRNQAMAADPGPTGGAEAEAGRLSDLGSRDADSPTDSHLGVAGGGDPDPLLGTADPPGGPIAGGPGAPGASAPPAAPPPPAPPPPSPGAPPPPDHHSPTSAQGTHESEPLWRAPDDSWTFVSGSHGSPPEIVWHASEHDDPLPPAPEHEDGRL